MSAEKSGDKRRKRILELLRGADCPISAGALAEELGVSRQIIVGDISLLRAAGHGIISTPRGYLTESGGTELIKTIVCHHSARDMERELNIMVDNGCEVLDVVIDHPVYGQLSGKLLLRSRHDVKMFVKDVEETGAPALSSLTGGVHIHTLRCPDDQAFERVVDELRRQGLLYEQ